MRHYLRLGSGMPRADAGENETFRDARSARAAAVKSLRALMAHRLREGKAIPADWAVDVINPAGEIVDTVTSGRWPSKAHRREAGIRASAARRTIPISC
jgi:hypothetical protein